MQQYFTFLYFTFLYFTLCTSVCIFRGFCMHGVDINRGFCIHDVDIYGDKVTRNQTVALFDLYILSTGDNLEIAFLDASARQNAVLSVDFLVKQLPSNRGGHYFRNGLATRP